MKSWDNKGAFDEARQRVLDLLNGKTMNEIQLMRCKRCIWHTYGRPCVWPKEMCLATQKHGTDSKIGE